MELVAPEPPYFLSAKRNISPVTFQNLDTDSCELIAIGHPNGAIFAQLTTLYQRNSDDAFGRIFWSPLLQCCRLHAVSRRKSAKVLSMANCGMRVAMDLGVIRDHVSRLYRYFWRAGYDVRKRVYLERHGTRSVFRAAAKEDHEGWMILSADLPSLGVQLCHASATNLLKRSLIKSEVKAW